MSEKFEEFRADLKLRYAILKNGKRIDGGISKKELDDVSSLFDGKKSNINSQTKESIRNGVRETLKLGFTINNEKDREVFLKLCKISGYELPDLGNLGEQILKSPHQDKPYSVIIENGKVEIYISGDVLGINSKIGEVDRNGKFIYENSFFTFDSSSNNNKFDIKGDFKNINYKEAKSYTGEAYFLREDGSMFVGKLLKGFPESGAIYYENGEIASGVFSSDFKLHKGTYYFLGKVSRFENGEEIYSTPLKGPKPEIINPKLKEQVQIDGIPPNIVNYGVPEPYIIIDSTGYKTSEGFPLNHDEEKSPNHLEEENTAEIKTILPGRKPKTKKLNQKVKIIKPIHKPINVGELYYEAIKDAKASGKIVQIKTPNGILFIHPDGSVKTK